MTESGADGENSGENAEFSIADIVAFQRRLETNPDSVSDDEIRAEYGDGISPSSLRELFRRSTFGRESKTPRASARAKLRRRLVWLSRSLDEVEDAVRQVSASPGRTYKQKELIDLLGAITQFRDAVRLPEPKSLPACDPDLLECLLSSPQQDWKPISSNANGADD
jgi:hypothetical protein